MSATHLQSLGSAQTVCHCHQCESARVQGLLGYAAGYPAQSVQPQMESEFTHFQRIRLKHIKEMLGQLNQDATGIHILRVEEASIEEFLGQ